jgi:hypothetical protein
LIKFYKIKSGFGVVYNSQIVVVCTINGRGEVLHM